MLSEADLLPRMPEFNSRLVYVESEVEKVALQQGFVRVLCFALSKSFHQFSLFTHLSHMLCNPGYSQHC